MSDFDKLSAVPSETWTPGDVCESVYWGKWEGPDLLADAARADAAEARVAVLEGAFDDLRALANECSRDRKSRAIEKRITEFFAVLP